MTFPEAVQQYRTRQLLPEEQVLAEQIAEYPVIERCAGCGGDMWLVEDPKPVVPTCYLCGLVAWHKSERNHLSEALVTLIAHDAGQPAPDAKDASRPWCEDHDRALLDCLLSLARQVVEYRVLLADLKAKIGEAQKIAEVAA